MSMYTTGEIAKLCGVSVRTVQYYDTRGILVPGTLSEGGRRLYSEDDLNKMKIICFLRSLELPIDSIKELLSDKDSEKVISMLLDGQESVLRREIAEKEEKAAKIADVKKTLRLLPRISAESFSDVAYIMENKKHLRRTHAFLLTIGLLMNAIQVSALALWIFEGIWWVFVLGEAIALALAVWASVFYFKRAAYICPECHMVFKPTFKESFFAHHTPYTRKLTCTHCGHRGFCIETYGKDVPTAANEAENNRKGGNNRAGTI